ITESKQQVESLKRSQKMDALGKLTGGIAHDYNNMLAVIIGYAQLVESASKENSKIVAYAQEIKKAGNRGAKLTSRLLAFSRTKPAEARDTNITELVNGAKLMLEKTLTARIQLNLSLSDDIWQAKLDQDDLEDAILNICINGMHAIEETGRMTISTYNCRLSKEQAGKLDMAAGDYIVIKVADSGIGMSEDVLSHIFDPFFSTKGEKGTGLGLTQVYGFVQRSDGYIDVESEVGKGTEFIIYFPRSTETNANDDKFLEVDEIGDNCTESILVVDDEEALVNLASKILSKVGYQVVSAGNAKQALNIMKQESFDLLFSDVIMPGISGYALASEVRKKYPLTKIQLVSGYDSNISVSEEDSLLKKQMMSKPYDDMKLLRTIRKLLDQ
ncbi:MAG: response regulator, partial [Gammaproteobacteria bacterium]|nr:response regulator [Gammaproteobacteria bacterium]